MATDHFGHSMLKHPARQFRLLESNLDTIDDQSLEYSLKTYDIDQCPPFYALSYVWGIDTPTHQILVNGKPFLVRENLWAILCELKKCHLHADINDKGIWIDAICINQQDISEKSLQVGMMGDVYSKAKATIAWLGPAADNSDSVMDRLEHLWYTGQESSIYKSKYEEEPEDRPTGAFVEREYFGRAWTIQEFVLSKELWIMCGSRMMHWSRFGPLYTANTHMQAKNKPARLGYTAGGVRNGLPLPVMIGPSGCLDHRDRIYAVIGLAKVYNNCLGDLTVDYDLPLRHLYFRVIGMLRDAPHGYENLKDWYDTFNFAQFNIAMAMDMPFNTPPIHGLMHLLIITSRRLDFYERPLSEQDEEDVWETLLHNRYALNVLIERVYIEGLKELRPPLDVDKIYATFRAIFCEWYVVEEDATGWRTFEIALQNSLLLYNNFYPRSSHTIRDVLHQWQNLDREDCWQVGKAAFLMTPLPGK